MNDRQIIKNLIGLVDNKLNQYSDDLYRSAMQLTFFDKEEYNKKYPNAGGYGSMLTADEYEKNLKDSVKQWENNKKIIQECKDWLLGIEVE